MVQTVISIVMMLSLVFGAMAVRASQRQRLRQLEMLYVQRYWALMDRLSLSALRGNPSTAVDAEDEGVVVAYLRLCEDQLELRKQGWLSTATWSLWSVGMEQQLCRWPFNAVWTEIRDADTEAFALLRELTRNPGWDPCVMSPARRLLNGVGGRGSI
jgi:hypothetical protein